MYVTIDNVAEKVADYSLDTIYWSRLQRNYQHHDRN